VHRSPSKQKPGVQSLEFCCHGNRFSVSCRAGAGTLLYPSLTQ